MTEENQLAVYEENTPPTPVHSPQPTMNAPPPLTSAGVPLAHHRAPSAHLPQPTSTSTPPPLGYTSPPPGYAPPPPRYMPSSATQAPPPAHDPTRMATLEGNVTTLQNSFDLMAANMAEMMTLLRGPNRASSSSTPPLARGPTVESLSGPALNWFISLRVEDIPSWTELAKKFVEQYQYNMETPPSFLELSTMEMGAYYSHLMGHKSTFSEMIMAGKQVDLGIKLGRLEGPTKKGEGESSRKTALAATLTGGRRSKEASVNAVNVGHNTYQDSKVPWTYEGSVGNLEQQFSVMGVTRTGRVYTNPDIASKGKAPAASGAAPEALPISQKKVTEEEAEAFMKVIKASEYKVLKETAPDRIEETVSSIFSNAISFSDDELPSEGWAHSRALHIVCKCNNFIIGRVMIDNGSALNVCPVSTLKQMNVDLHRIRPSKIAVRAFDGSRREVNGEIDLLIDVGPCSFSVTFQVLDIPNAFSLLLGRPWIHSAGAVPSSLHQRIKFIADDRLITIEEYKNRRGLGFRPSCHESIEARRGKHLHHLAVHYGKINRGIPVLPLSHLFPAPPHIVGGTLDGPSSISDAKPVNLPVICAVTEETPLGVHIRLAQKNEELNNWTSVPCYSVVIADV
ncbi:hypothetical protein CRG98_038382 [Punica granatum]|uniref:Retrotransposon gag domain-containing protein n=1 Tax=Punica granatum TaxID=22663 RepID=A0A2I0IB59_PUNGR|nr:hypothetical protein CRG98_038382 [Punica granatum]